MPGKRLALQRQQFDQQRKVFRLIDPDDYAQLGIDPEDVPMGTFAAEDHPTFLPSRFGGNAYGLGVAEQGVLTSEDTDFLETLDFQDTDELGQHDKRVNTIFQKLGLLIRVSRTGKTYYLIPINLVAHSLHEIKTKADEIERLIIQYMFEMRAERLDIGLLTRSHDLLVHELTARLTSHRIFLFESIENLDSWRVPLDIIIFPKDPFEYLLEQKLPKPLGRQLNRQRLFRLSAYLAGKIYDLLEPGGRVVLLSHFFDPREDRACKVHFKSDEELKNFLLFSHIFRTRKPYSGNSSQLEMTVALSDLHYYLNKFAFFETHWKRLLGQSSPDHLSVEEINLLPYLDQHLHRTHTKDPEKQWKLLLGPYFATRYLRRKSPKDPHPRWDERLDLEGELSESLLVFVGERRQPGVTLPDLESDLHRSGMQGCSLPLVAEYRNSFQYVLDVLRILTQIRDHRLAKQSELEQSRLSNPFLAKNESLHTVAQLLGHISKLERIRDTLNPENIEGQTTRVLENIAKLSLQGFSREQLLEILLIVVGHTTMSRVVFGKTPARSLKPITDKARQGPFYKILELLRFCRLMSMAEIIAAFKDSFTQEHSRELFHLYDAAIAVATDPWLDWEKLQDLRISALGGVQNMAIREMMKFFNLFEFLDDWQDLIRKGNSQREVVCDYEPEKLRQMEEAIELSQLAAQFNRQYISGEIFGQSNFFRQFLETEFHGTGHLFPMLGAKAGFLLVWIAVGSSERHVVNFNPVLEDIPQDRYKQRIAKIKDALLQIPQDMLAPPYFDRLRKTLAEGMPAFILDTGIRIMNNLKTGATEVSFVDVAEDILRIEALLRHFERQKLTVISLKQLHELERFFSELESFHRNIHLNASIQQDASSSLAGGVRFPNAKGPRIEEIERRLKTIMQNHILVPGEVSDTVSSLVRYCPEILRFVLPEFHALGSLMAQYPTSQKQSLGEYVMRCLQKFQALVTKDRNAFQDRNTFYQLAKEEFGALAEEGIGASHSQLDLLEYIAESIQQRPLLLGALMVALLFQEIGKIEASSTGLFESDVFRTPAERGAFVLERTDILDRYNLDPQMKDLVILLVRHHGLIGRVLLGEEPASALERLTAGQDEQLLDAFVLQAVLNAAAVQEGLMISDILEGFLNYRAVGHRIIRSKSNWQTWLEESLQDKGKAVMPAFRLDGSTAELPQSPSSHSFDSTIVEVLQDDLRQGRQVAAFERMLRLMGVTWVDFQDLQMFLMEMPVSFIYYKKKLKSVGLSTFEAQLLQAGKVFEIVSAFEPDMRSCLLYSLDHLGGSVHVRAFHFLPQFLEIEACVKLLAISFMKCRLHFGPEAKNSLICFESLSRNIERVHTALQRDLRNLPFAECSSDPEQRPSTDESHAGIQFQVNVEQQLIRVEYSFPIRLNLMVQSLTTIWDRESLCRRLQELINELKQKLPFEARDHENALRKACTEQQNRINDRVLEEFQERLGCVLRFSEFHELRQEFERQQSELQFSDEQRFVLREMFEFHRSRTRDRYIESIYQKINAIHSREVLLDFWNNLKYELFSYRTYLGKEFELLIAQLVDQKLESM
jgi:hypothetical protein